MTVLRNRGLSLVAAAVCTLALSACGSDDGGSGSSDEVRILVSAPLSGDSAETGQDMVNGAKLAAEYLNEQGGVQSGDRKGQKFVIEGADDELETQAATTIAAKFAGDDKYYGLTGYLTSGQAQAAAVVLDKYGLGLVSSFSGADFLVDDADNVVLMLAPGAALPVAVADFVTKDLGAKTAASISGDFSFLDSYHAGLKRGAKESGLTLTSQEMYGDGASDFSTLLTRINRDEPDVLLSGAFQGDAGKIASQARKAGMNQPFVDYLGEGWGESFRNAAGSALTQGDFYAASPTAEFPEDDSLMAQVAKKFLEAHGKPMPSAAAYTFESVLVIAATIEAGASDRKDFISHVTKASGEGILGPIGFTEELQPTSRPITFSKLTGAGPQDRELVARYVAYADGSAERQ